MLVNVEYQVGKELLLMVGYEDGRQEEYVMKV